MLQTMTGLRPVMSDHNRSAEDEEAAHYPPCCRCGYAGVRVAIGTSHGRIRSSPVGLLFFRCSHYVSCSVFCWLSRALEERSLPQVCGRSLHRLGFGCDLRACVWGFPHPALVEKRRSSSHSSNALALTFIDDYAYAQHGPVIPKRRLARPAGVADLNR